MVGLLTRLGIVCLGLAATGLLAPAALADSGKVAAALAAIAAFGFLFERKNLRRGEWALGLALVEMVGIAAWLGFAGVLDKLGFLVLAPAAIAIQCEGVGAPSLAPLVGASFLVGHMLSTKDGGLTAWPIAQAIVLSLGASLIRPPRVETVVRTVSAESSEPAENVLVSVDEYLELRESFRTVRDQYRELERKTRRDRLVASIAELRETASSAVFPKLAARLCELTGAEDAAIYTLAQFDDTMVVRASTAKFPNAPGLASVSVDVRAARATILHRFERSLNALAHDEPRKFVNQLLLADGRALGLITLLHHDATSLDSIRQRLEDIADVVTSVVREEQNRQDRERRSAELELLYELASLTRGSESLEQAAATIVRELAAATAYDHLSISLLGGDTIRQVAHAGAELELIDALKFANGIGVSGWLDSGAPETMLFDARNDERCDPDVCLKRRIGSYFVAPIRTGGEVVGYISAASHRSGGIDAPEASTLRAIARELSRSARTDGRQVLAEGVLAPVQFQSAIEGRTGALVVLELLGGAKLAERFGHPAIAFAVKKLLAKLQEELPPEGCICRRGSKEFVAFLPNQDADSAASWANAATAHAALTGIHAPDGQRLPLGLKVKVASLTADELTISHRLSA